MTHTLRAATALVALATLLPSSTAYADYPTPAPYLGVHLGPQVVPNDWDLGGDSAPNGPGPLSSIYGMGGLRFGWQWQSRIAFEAGVSLLPIQSKAFAKNTALSYDLSGLYHFTPGDVSTYALAGIGGFHQLNGDLTGDFDPQVHLGVGLRGLVLPKLAIRIEIRDYFTDGFEGQAGNVLQVRFGLDVFLAGKPDKDKDGITDDVDSCPTVFGVTSAAGCPDQDGDGLADTADTCPAEPGTAALGGCPDKDGDGIADKDDTCPAEAGPKELGGCPDKDGDGIADKDDTCPDVKGLAALKGCPDADGDGLTDASDTCPQEPGPRATKGCPDRDHDGVADAEDKCPDVTGLRSNAGCVPDVVKKFTGAIKGINFETGSAKILPASYPTLDQAVKVLKDFPEVSLRIEGHTDDVGDDAANMKLSQDRAASVREYLISKGIEAARLEAKGYGETKPVADNKTSKGKAQNRRIEFGIVGAE